MNDMNVPDIIGGEKVVCYTPAHTIAICKCETQEGYYLFRCNSSWKEFADTWHETIEDAQDQAEFEYSGIVNNWKYK
jgi:hypothetical protein